MRMRDARDVGIAQERQNRVIEGRGGNLDLTARGELFINRNYATYDLDLLTRHVGLIVERVTAFFSKQALNLYIVGLKLFIKPGKLGKHLQIANILCAEHSPRTLRILAGF